MKHFGSIVLLGVKFIKKMPSKRSHNANMKKLFDKPMPKLRLVNIKLTQVMPFTDKQSWSWTSTHHNWCFRTRRAGYSHSYIVNMLLNSPSYEIKCIWIWNSYSQVVVATGDYPISLIYDNCPTNQWVYDSAKVYFQCLGRYDYCMYNYVYIFRNI